MNNYLLIYQLEEYDLNRYLSWIFKNFFNFQIKKRTTKNVTWTIKTKLILVISLILFLSALVLLVITTNILIVAIFLIISWVFRFLYLILARYLIFIPERYKKTKYLESMQKKLEIYPNLRVIGITGSTGKTSVKYILQALLSQKTLISPDSTTTELGIAKVIDIELNQRYDNFICEFSANKKGDIKKLCELVKPQIGLLTTINEQHLERFRNIESTVSTKFELLQNLALPNIGIVNLDSPLIKENLSKSTTMRLIGYSLDNNTAENCHAIFHATNIKIVGYATHFDVRIFGQEYHFQTRLLGKNHLSNILAAIVCAIEMQEKPEQLVDRVRELNHIPHRLALVNFNGIDVLDDTSSSNVSGFKEALRVLNKFSGKKVIATPGIGEIGSKSNNIHRMLGGLCAKNCDILLIVGKSTNTKYLMIGALENSFKKDNIIRLNSTKEVYKYIEKNLQPGDSVLIENEIPNQYD